uniref:Uncharacterized protein n=1 Tax=Solanum lycopersicum TaxID=4081 RepID=A0A3Q7HKV6_SOLLC
MPNFFVDIRQDLVYAYGWPSRLVRPIWKVNRAPKRAYPSFRRFSCAIAHHFLGDPDSDVKNAKVFPHHFLGDPDSNVKNAKLFRGRPSRSCLCIRLAITTSHHFLGDPDSDFKNAKFFRGHPSSPCLCIRLVITASHHFLSDPDSDVKKAKFFHGRPSRPFLCIQLAITTCSTYLKGQTSLEARIPLIRRFSCAIAHNFLGDPDSDVKMPHFFVDVRQDLFYVYDWTSRLFRPIWKVKRAPKRAYPSFRRFSCAIAHHFLGDPDSNIKNVKFFRGRPSRPCLCIRLDITAYPTYFEAHHFLGDPDSDVKNVNFFRGLPSRPCLCIRIAITACPTHLEGQTSPEATHHFLGDLESDVQNSNFFRGRQSRPYQCIRLSITSCPTHLEAHHFLGDPDSDVKNVKFFRGRPSRPCLRIWLAITACTTYLKGQTSPEASIPLIRRFSCAIAHHFLGDPNSDVKKAKFFHGRPSRPCLCIRLAITACPTNFKGQTSPEASIPLILTIFIPTSKIPNFFVDVSQDLVYAYGWPSCLVRPVWKVKRAPKRAYPSFRRFLCAIAHHFLGNPDFDVKNVKFFRGRPSRPCLRIRLSITACSTYLKGQTSPEASIPLIRRFSCAIAHYFLGDPDSDVKNATFFCGRPSRPCLYKRLAITAFSTHLEAHRFLGDPDFDVKNAKFFRGRRSRPCLRIRLSITACTTYLKGQTSPEASIPLIRRFSCAIAHHFLGDPDSDEKKAKFFHVRPSRPCLCIRLAITACPKNFKGQTSPEASIPLILTIFIPTSKIPNFFVDVSQDLVYAYGWPSCLVRPVWKVKRAPKRAYPSFRRFLFAIAHHFLGNPDFDVKNVKFFRGRPSRPCLRIRLSITACSTYLKGQTSPEASIPLIRRFSCAIAHHFLGDQDSDVKNATFFCGRPSRPCLYIRLAITAFSTHLEAHHFLGDPDFDVKNAKFFRGRRSRPCLRIRLAITACTTYLKGQTSPEASIPLIRHFLGDPDSDVKNATFFCGRLTRPCLCIQVAITACKTHLECQMSPEMSIPLISTIFVSYCTPFLGDPDSDVKNSKFFLRRPSRPCLSIRLAITACTTHLEVIRQDLVYAYGGPSRLVRPIWKANRAPKRAYPSFRRFSCAIAHNFLGDPDSNVKNAKFFCGRPSRPCLCIQFVITACPTHLEAHHFLVIRIPTSKMPNFFVDVSQDLFYAYSWPSRIVRPIWKVKRAPKRAYPSFQRFSCAIAHHFLGDPDFDVKNAKFFRGRPSRPFLCLQLAITACLTHLEAHHFLGDPDSDVKNAKFFRGHPSRPFLCIRLAITACLTHLEDLVYAYGWPSRLVRPIRKVNRAPNAIAHHFLGEPDSDVKNAKMFSWTSIKTLYMHTVKRAPKRAYPSFRRFSCVIAHHFLGDPDSDVKNAKVFRKHPSRSCICIRLAITACTTHLEAHHFLGDPDFDVKNAKFFRGRPSRPCLLIRLAITACTTYLKGQTSPEASIPLIRHFLGDPDSDVKNATFFCGRPTRPFLCIQLAITACKTHLEGQTSPEMSIPLISTIFVCYCTPFLGDPDSDVKNSKFFLRRPSRPCLSIRLAITACTIHLEGQTSPEASIPLILMIFVCYSTPFFGQDIVYAYGGPSRLVRPIWKTNQAPKRAYPSFR